MEVSIIGTGSYGIALALNFIKNNNVTMYTKFEDEKEEILKTRENHIFKGVKIDERIKITSNIEEACQNKDIIVICVPISAVCQITKDMAPYIKDQIIVSATKGIEQETCLFVSEIVKKHMNDKNFVVIAGPSFAIDMVKDNPIGLSVGSLNNDAIEIVKNALQNDNLKLRGSNDVKGIEICSSIKNVIAIGSGILNGLNVNESTKAMFITESLNDIKNLIDELGGDKKTILSFAGFGDILLTCTSKTSRNFMYGEILITKDKSYIENYRKSTTIEGLYTLESIHKLINKEKVNIDIINLLYEIVFNNLNPNEILNFLIEKK